VSERLTSHCNRPPAARAAAERPVRYTDTGLGKLEAVYGDHFEISL
jgi:hypothetical protein